MLKPEEMNLQEIDDEIKTVRFAIVYDHHNLTQNKVRDLLDRYEVLVIEKENR